MGKITDLAQQAALYCDAWSAQAGARVAVQASGAGDALVSLVRLTGLDQSKAGLRFRESVVGRDVPIVVEPRATPLGSFAESARPIAVDAGCAWAWEMDVFPSSVGGGTLFAWGQAVALTLQFGRLNARLPGAHLQLPLDRAAWTRIVLSMDGKGEARLALLPIGPGAAYRRAAEASAAAAASGLSGAILIGRGFNGKLGRLQLMAGAQRVAAWSFADHMTLQSIPGQGRLSSPLQLHNAPRRAVTGAAWTGAIHDWRAGPEHYDAVHFHDDDLADCCWPTTTELTIPADAPSGVYAIRLQASSQTRYAPMFVRPSQPRRLAFLAPTFSYLAYGNSLWASPSGVRMAEEFPEEASQMRQFGLSTYSVHTDGSGVGLVSTRRPILNWSPGFLGETVGGQALFCDDLRIIQWLSAQGEPFDVITDHDLHAEGPAALAAYDVVVTGSHPEYQSAQTMNAIETFQAKGGRLIYLGGNGFYWRVDTLPDAPHVMEIRRAEGGIRMWAEAPGEYHHQSDGALGGLWRRIGRAPNRLVGVGYSAQGDTDETRPYRLTPAARDPRARFLFAGLKGEWFGQDQGVGAAAGYELDRADLTLGTPPHALVVARSDSFGDTLAPVNEERLTHTVLAAEDPLRADMTFFETPSGGAVLSMGSVLFAATLSEADGAGRVAANALARFLDPAPFAMPTLETPDHAD